VTETTKSAICYGPGFDTLDMNPWRPRWLGKGTLKVKISKIVEDSEVFDSVSFFSKDYFDGAKYCYSKLCMRLWVKNSISEAPLYNQVELHPELVDSGFTEDKVQNIVRAGEEWVMDQLAQERT